MTYGPATYGECIAPVYDEWYSTAAPELLDTLAELAARGPALELGIGTGRVALPLAARGVAVHGVDASPAMLARLRSRPGGEALPVALADFARLPDDAAVQGPFALVYVVFNTFFALLTQEDQVNCFRSVAARLRPGGCFLLEAFVPDPGRFDQGQTLRTGGMEERCVTLEASRHDPVTQTVTSQHLVLRAGSAVELYPVRLRYAWPAELDLMGELAGLRLVSRWGGWQREPFTAASTAHVSLYEKPAAARDDTPGGGP